MKIIDSTVQVLDDKSVRDVIREIASGQDQEEAFYVVDLSDLVWKHKQWKLLMPRVEPFYAVKCNDTTTVLEVLAALGTGFDCASKGEIQKVLDLGVDQSRIIYANPCKTASYIKYAAKNDVSLMTFDNEAELYKVKNLFPAAKMVLRIRVDGKARCPLGVKFGVEPAKAVELLEVAKELGVNVVGISFHVGSGCEEASVYEEAIREAYNLFVIAEKMGFDFNLLDLGGGFPGQKNSPLNFTDIVKVINDNLDIYFPMGCGVRIIAEPGRYYVASAFTLCVNVIAKRSVIQPRTEVKNEEQAFMYYVNDGVYGSFNCLLYDHAEVTAIPLRKSMGEVTFRSSVWGPTCDGLDCILKDCQLPLFEVGDWLMFEEMGAYTVAAASTFNGFQKPGINYVASRSTWLYLQNLLVSSEFSTAEKSLPMMKTGYDISEDSIYPLDVALLDPIFAELSMVDV